MAPPTSRSSGTKRSKHERRTSPSSSHGPRYEQLRLCRNLHGGWRPGSGRPRSGSAGVTHQTRSAVTRHQVVHVTMKLRDGLRGLRNDGECQEVWRHLIAGSLRDGFRIVHATVQSNHLHLLCEGESRDSLWRGMCGVATRIAKGLNRFWGRRGKVFKERYHDRVMGSPKEVRWLDAAPRKRSTSRRASAGACSQLPIADGVEALGLAGSGTVKA